MQIIVMLVPSEEDMDELWSETTAELFDPELSQNLVAKALTIGGRLVEVSTRVREAQAAS